MKFPLEYEKVKWVQIKNHSRSSNSELQKLNIILMLMQKFLYPKVLSKLNYSCFIKK